jgi:multidrug efflux pump
VFSRFFIDRPIFATVMSIIITLVGAISFFTLPMAQYPQITPPTVQVDCNYPGANAETVAESIAAPIEQQVNGVENMMYMISNSTSDGSYTLTVTFKLGVDLDQAQVLLQNRVNLALPQLPQVVQATGVTTRKRSSEILLVVYVYSPDRFKVTNAALKELRLADVSEPVIAKLSRLKEQEFLDREQFLVGLNEVLEPDELAACQQDLLIHCHYRRYDQVYLSNYALMHLREELQRLPGISDVLLFGQRDYSMRIWVDPELLATRSLTPADVVSALQEQNLQVAAGQVGQPPIAAGQPFQITLSTLGRLSTPEQFEQIIVKKDDQGRVVRIKDIGRVGLDAKNEDVNNRFNGQPTVGLAIFMLADANALETADIVKAKMKELAKEMPEGVAYEIGYDTTPFIRESVNEVFKTLRDAVILVAIVVLVFLQSWRTALIPLLAVPVAIIGTFAAMAAVGFSLNNLTLFGLVLAVGIVVDDAIVVVEAVEHYIELGMSPRDATIKAMDQVSGPIVAVGFVLTAVFIPCTFLTGIVGQFFRQFALTIAISALISTINSLTFSPALAALLLKPKNQRNDPLTWLLNTLFGWFFRLFERGFRFSASAYAGIVGRSLRLMALVLFVYVGLIAVAMIGFNGLPERFTPHGLENYKVGTFDLATGIPRGFIPAQDKGYFLASVRLPDSASAERTLDVMQKMETIANDTPGVSHASGVAGNSFVLSAYGSNFGSMFIILKSFEERKRDPSKSGNALLAKLKTRFVNEIPEAQIDIYPAPAVSGLGRAGGFKLMIEDRGDAGMRTLQAVTDSIVERGNKQAGLIGLNTVFKTNSPTFFLDIDRKKCLSQGVRMGDLFEMLRGYLGSRYANDFNLFGRTWQVVVQAESTFRNDREDILRLKVRNDKGQMVPLGTLASVRETSAPLVVTRYNTYLAAAINGNFAPGFSSGDAIAITEAMCNQELPSAMNYEWSELTYLEKTSGGTNFAIFGASVLFVFLVLAALYESWKLPLAVILVVPMCVLGSITGVAVANRDINIFTQVGFLVLVGLACKNAILIVEFAKKRREEGVPRREATIEACKLRYRPIMMTSCSFILGVLPLVLATGAGSEMRQALGTAIFSGMICVTIFGIFLTPTFFNLIDSIDELKWDRAEMRRKAASILTGPVQFAGNRLNRFGTWIKGKFRQRAQ